MFKFKLSLKHRPFVVILAFILIILFGTIGYVLLEDYTPLEALYMTVITLTTVGFGEVRPLDNVGRIFTIVLITVGLIFVISQLAYIGEYIIDGHLLRVYRRKRVKKQLSEMENHYIICGYGQMGKVVVSELMSRNAPVVVVDNSPDEELKLTENNIPHLLGDATDEETLLSVGIKKAKGLVSVVTKDTDNVFIVLTARDLNKDLFICARASSPGTEKRLIKAGANRVVSPYISGAKRIAQNILRPTVTDFIELALSGEGMELSMEEIKLLPNASIVGKDLIQSELRNNYNLIVIAIKRADGTMIYNPSPREVFQEGDILITIGPKNNLEKFAKDISKSSSISEGICSCGHYNV